MNESQRSFFRASMISMQAFRNQEYESDREPLIIKDDGNSALEITQESGRISSLTVEMVQATAIPMCAICWAIIINNGVASLRVF